MLREPIRLTTDDGLNLEGELVAPDQPWAGVVLTHPNSREGGNMRSMVPGELIDALPAIGVATLRFNFRGVGGSDGVMEDGAGERRDITAAIEALHAVVEGLPLVIVGSSFGANTALTVPDPRLSAWVACAPTLQPSFVALTPPVAADERPKHFILAARDQLRPAEEVLAEIAGWKNTTWEIIPGTDHFFVGRIELVVAAVQRFLRALAGPA